MQSDAQKIIELLDLKPLPLEGGFFRETYRATESISPACLPTRYSESKSFSTAIYYLLTPDTFSRMHKLPTDEIFHFYLGDPVEMLQLHPDGSGSLTILGNRLFEGMNLQHIVLKNTWQGARLQTGGKFALLGTTMAPAFDFKDFCPADRNDLLKKYPTFAEHIEKLL